MYSTLVDNDGTDQFCVDTHADLVNYLRNEFNFCKVHGIMNTSGLLRSKCSSKGFTLTLQETRVIHDSMNPPKTLQETRKVSEAQRASR